MSSVIFCDLFTSYITKLKEIDFLEWDQDDLFEDMTKSIEICKRYHSKNSEVSENDYHNQLAKLLHSLCFLLKDEKIAYTYLFYKLNNVLS
jgi:hypothetical protein